VGNASVEMRSYRYCCSRGKRSDFKDTREFSIYDITKFGMSKSNPIHEELPQ
jgi:hypothetical protein